MKVTDKAFAAVMHNLDTMTARQSLSHASLAKDYAADHVDDGNPLDAVPQLINAVGHIIDALTTMQKEAAQS